MVRARDLAGRRQVRRVFKMWCAFPSRRQVTSRLATRLARRREARDAMLRPRRVRSKVAARVARRASLWERDSGPCRPRCARPRRFVESSFRRVYRTSDGPTSEQSRVLGSVNLSGRKRTSREKRRAMIRPAGIRETISVATTTGACSARGFPRTPHRDARASPRARPSHSARATNSGGRAPRTDASAAAARARANV